MWQCRFCHKKELGWRNMKVHVLERACRCTSCGTLRCTEPDGSKVSYCPCKDFSYGCDDCRNPPDGLPGRLGYTYGSKTCRHPQLHTRQPETKKG
jgi:hypothetical protein